MTQSQPLLHGFELSAQQARVTRWHRTYPAAAARAELRVQLPAGVELGRLRACLDRVIARHEILRTRYEYLPGMAVPVQVIDEPGAARAVELALSEGGEPLAIVRVPAASADTASLHQLAAEWARTYAGVAPAEPPLQYADYAAWRNELVGTGEARAFWDHQLALRAPAAPLPLLRGTAATITPGALAAHAIECPRELWEVWAHCAASLGVGSVQIALVAWVALWHRHADADRLTLAIDAQQRGEHLGDALGLFSEPLPLTVELAAATTAAELCRALAARAAELADWRDYAPHFGDDVPAIGFRALPPLDPVLAAHGWSIEADSPTVPAQLLLEVQPPASDADRGPRLVLHHDRARYSAASAALLADQLVAALAEICRDPRREVRAVSLVSAAERRALDAASRPDPVDADRSAAYARITAAPHLAACLSSRAARDAVVAASGTLTHEELDARAAQLAAVLARRGIGRGHRVAHALPRDLDAIVALIAIFRLGAAYVPLDPAYPERRIAFVLDDCGADAIVTRRALIDRLPAAWRDERRLVFTDDASATAAPASAPATIAPDDTAYVIYTSGSTGEPKGVPIAHRAALHSLAARFAYYPTPVRRFLLLSSFSFDSSIAGLLWTLAQGGCLHLAADAELRDPARLAARIVDEDVSHLLALPSLYHLLLGQLAGRATALDTVIVAGEACPRRLVDAHERAFPGVRLYNEYGPTEAAVWSTVARCRAGDGPVPIGRPILGSRVHVLDAAGAPVARGVRGEIHIGGAGLAAGYLDRPALTAERFVEIRGERLYRTGDLGAWDDGGELHFLGRADGQIKIRGFRVELGEIEAALARAAATETVAVVARPGEDGELLLRGFVESAHGFDEPPVRRALAAHLPAHMIPVDLAALPALPRTANGKIDRTALAALEVHAAAPYVAPRGDTERALAALWTELLGAARAATVGRDDDFFALGGHSLLVVRLVHRVREALGVALPVSAVFDQPRLASLAAVIEGGAAGIGLLRAGSHESGPVLFCVHDAAGTVRQYAALDIDARLLGLPLPPPPSHDDIAAIAAAHVETLRAHQPAGPYRLVGWSIGGVIAHEIARRLEALGERVDFLALIDSTPHTEDAPLPWATLLARLCAELTAASAARLEALPPAALDALRTATDGKLPVAQLRHALLAWAPQHALELAAPAALIESALDAAATARRWLAAHHPGEVSADLHLWWSDDTLRRDPALPAFWRARTRGTAHDTAIRAGHDELLANAELHAGFHASLAAALRGRA